MSNAHYVDKSIPMTNATTFRRMGRKTTTLSMQLILGEERSKGPPAASRERGTGESTGWKCTVSYSISYRIIVKRRCALPLTCSLEKSQVT
jgi:hypothetical protein